MNFIPLLVKRPTELLSSQTSAMIRPVCLRRGYPGLSITAHILLTSLLQAVVTYLSDSYQGVVTANASTNVTYTLWAGACETSLPAPCILCKVTNAGFLLYFDKSK